MATFNTAGGTLRPPATWSNREDLRFTKSSPPVVWTSPKYGKLNVFFLSYPSSHLIGEGLNQAVDAMVCQYRCVKEKLLVIVDFVLDVKFIRHKGVPVVKGVELRGDPVLVLETLVEEKFRIKFELEVVSTKVLDIIFNHNFDRLTCKVRIQNKR